MEDDRAEGNYVNLKLTPDVLDTDVVSCNLAEVTYSNSFRVETSGFSTGSVMSSANSDSLTASLPTLTRLYTSRDENTQSENVCLFSISSC